MASPEVRVCGCFWPVAFRHEQGGGAKPPLAAAFAGADARCPVRWPVAARSISPISGGFAIGGERMPLVPASPGSWQVDLAK
jgi:hypothetical protein